VSVTFAADAAIPTASAGVNQTFSSGELVGDDFLRLMIVQLVHQDPLDPVKNAELLGQISAIKNMETLSSLDATMKRMTLQQQVTSGGALIGKLISGVSNAGANTTGIVVRVSVSSEGVTFVTDTGQLINANNLQSIEEVPNNG
jgi:flagellar basal-body rod modification protein FlgD